MWFYFTCLAGFVHGFIGLYENRQSFAIVVYVWGILEL